MTMAILTESTDPHPDVQPNNSRRRKKSIVWDYFTVETINADCSRALCKQCKKSFAYITGSKLAGTSHLKRHISLGICPVSRGQGNNQLSVYNPALKSGDSNGVTHGHRKRQRHSSVSPTVTFDEDRCRYELAKMIIIHEYPFNIVEHPEFIGFVRALQPQFSSVSLETIQSECVGVYLREKQGLLNLLGGVPGRINLTLDLWAMDHTQGYLFISGHFIDSDWKLHRRILDVVRLPFLNSESAFNQAVDACTTNWNMDSKLFYLTLDESFANETVRRNLRDIPRIKDPLFLKGLLLIENCYARVLSRLAQDALGLTQEIVMKVRDNVKYVKTSHLREETFLSIKQQLQVPSSKILVLDNGTQWDTTYQMLAAASELKEVFSCLDTCDPNYRGNLSTDEWKMVEILCYYLKLFFEAADILTTSSMYPTTDTFFHPVWKIQLELMQGATSDNDFIGNLTKPLHENFDKYWRDCSMVLSVAVILDPRFKMKFLEFSFKKLYGEDAHTWISMVADYFQELFNEYVARMIPFPSLTFEVNRHCNMETGFSSEEANFLANGIIPKTEISNEELLDGFGEFDLYVSETSVNQMKRELDQYLEEPCLPRTHIFDVLGWWRVNEQRFPTLSRMASDVLCIPVSTVSPDAVFDINSKKMDSYRSSLRHPTLEALICAKDWLQHGSSGYTPLPVSDAFVKTEY